MDRLFLDANVLFSAAYRPNPGLLKLWKLKNVILCSSRHALHLFDAPPKELPDGVLLPDKDVPILLAAIEARATHLITGDLRHFGPYFGKIIQGILVLPPGNYLKKAGPRR